MKNCTEKIAGWLIRCNAIKSEDRELYEYALYCIFLTFSPIFLAIVFGLLYGAVWRSLLIIFPFMVIRKFSGGYHAKTATTCLLSSSLLLIMCITLSFYINSSLVLIGITVGTTISLICFSPIDNKNRPLSEEEKKHYKQITVTIAVSFIIADLLLFWFQLDICGVCISIGLILSAALQIPCIITEMKKKHNKNQKNTKNVV